jgi:hypothetical protein
MYLVFFIIGISIVSDFVGLILFEVGHLGLGEAELNKKASRLHERLFEFVIC